MVMMMTPLSTGTSRDRAAAGIPALGLSADPRVCRGDTRHTTHYTLNHTPYTLHTTHYSLHTPPSLLAPHSSPLSTGAGRDRAAGGIPALGLSADPPLLLLYYSQA